MDFNPTAMPSSLVTGEFRIHACIHHTFQYFVVHA